MAKRVAEEGEQIEVKKRRDEEACPSASVDTVVTTGSDDKFLLQLCMAQLDQLNEQKKQSPRDKSSKRVQWTGFYRRKTDEYDVEIPLDYHRIKTISSTEGKVILTASHKDTGDVYVIRRVDTSDHLRIQQIFRTLMLHRLVPNDVVMRPRELYIRSGFLYTMTEKSESQLRDIVEDPTTHYCVARIVHQLLSLLNKMHKLGLIHGQLNTDTVYLDTDLSIKVTDFGNAGTMVRDPAMTKNQDLIAVRSILAKLLLAASPDEERKEEEDEDELDWKNLMESPKESGLTDENARELLDLMFENKYATEELLRHDYFKSFKIFEVFEPENDQAEETRKAVDSIREQPNIMEAAASV